MDDENSEWFKDRGQKYAFIFCVCLISGGALMWVFSNIYYALDTRSPIYIEEPQHVSDTTSRLLSDTDSMLRDRVELSSPSTQSQADTRVRVHLQDDLSETDEGEASHPGTKPEDPMFGFDYWDDADDAYEMERNQSDPYPDDY